MSEAFDSYVSRKEKDGVHGNNPEMQAASELFNRPIEVYVPEKGSEFWMLFLFLQGRLLNQFVEGRNERCHACKRKYVGTLNRMRRELRIVVWLSQC